MLKKDIRDFYIGKVIKEKVEERKMKIEEFATQIGRVRTGAYPIFNSKSIDIELLIKISKVLDYNFLLEYFEEKPFVGKHIIVIEADKAALESIVEKLTSNPSTKTLKTWIDERV